MSRCLLLEATPAPTPLTATTSRDFSSLGFPPGPWLPLAGVLPSLSCPSHLFSERLDAEGGSPEIRKGLFSLVVREQTWSQTMAEGASKSLTGSL